ncbi:4282_t:CDS:1, partial [Acaulospora colombiana]
MSNHLPVPAEIWQTILRYAISVPVFLDPYQGETHSFRMRGVSVAEWSNEAAYWRTERVLNTLQDVCHLWRHYLQQYEHRFVRIADVAHGIVPLVHLGTAARVSTGRHEYLTCRECCSKDYLPGNEFGQNTPFELLCWAILRRIESFQATILDLQMYCSYRSELPLHAFHNLVTFQAMESRYRTSYPPDVINSLPNLRYWYANGHVDGDSDQPVLSTTLRAIRLRFPSSELAIPTSWNLPALRHLDINLNDVSGTRRLLDSLPSLLNTIGTKL